MAVLLPVLGSGGLLAAAVAVLVIGPVEVGMTRMTTLVLEALEMFPKLHVTMPPDSPQMLAGVDEADTKVTLTGSVSVRVTAVDDEGPSLNTLIW